MLKRLLLLLALLTLPVVSAHAADMFGKPDSPPASAEPATPIEQKPDVFAPNLPDPFRSALSSLVEVQRQLNTRLRGDLRAVRDQGGLTPALAIITISFLYGIFHAVGPGHGKVVVGSYFLSRRSRLLHGLAMSGSAALVQSVSAIILVGLLALVLEAGSSEIMARAGQLEELSYAAICGLGLWMAWGVISGRTCCEHHDDEAHGAHDAHDHHEHDHCGCGHYHHHDHAHKPVAKPQRPEWLQVILTGGAVGLRPCSGAILVLLFTLANGIFWVGVVSTLAMGVGVAITVSVVSLGMVGLQRGLSAIGAERTQRLRQGLALTGSLLITLLGAAQLYGIWSGLVPAIAG